MGREIFYCVGLNNCNLRDLLVGMIQIASFNLILIIWAALIPYFIFTYFAGNNNNQPVSIVYVPSHLYHMLFELFKVELVWSKCHWLESKMSHSFASYSQNAMRATIETHENSNELPSIQVMVSLGGEDMSIKVGPFWLQYVLAESTWCKF